MKKFAYFIPVLFIALSFIGCARKINSPAPSHTQTTSTIKSRQKITLHDADAIALNDLPIPLGFDLITYNQAGTVTYLCFQGKLPTEKIVTFLETDTERNGWTLENLASPKLEAYYLIKPGRKAIITIEQKVSRTLININLKISDLS
jgi:hypothetical protein